MKISWIGLAAVATIVFSGSAAPAHADENTQVAQAHLCENFGGATSSAQRVTACTALLGGGGLTEAQEAQVRTNRAWALSLEGRMAEARADYERSVELAPNSHVAHNEFGLFELRTGHFNTAIAQYDIALKLRPGAAYSLYGRGLARIRLGETKAGQDDLAQARLAEQGVDQVFHDIGLAP